MSETENTARKALLPKGFIDLLPPYAEAEARATNTLMTIYAAYGYDRIKPPLLEFEDSLMSSAVGARLAQDTFRLMDPLSMKMLAVRSDVTAQVARIAGLRLKDAPRPLRLTYANDALRTCGGQTRTERQFTQVGCELIGGVDDQPAVGADIEICVLAVQGLRALQVADITLDFTIPNFVSLLFSHCGEALDDDVLLALKRRDVDVLRQHDGRATAVLATLIEGGASCDAVLAVVDASNCGQALADAVAHLGALRDGVAQALADLQIDDVHFSFDVLEQDGFEYHTGWGLTLFSKQISGELGRGGCYTVEDDTARGFTLYMDTVSRHGVSVPEKMCVFVPHDTPWAVIQDLQAQGWITLRGIGAQHQPPASCTHIYKDNKINQL